MPIRQYCRRKPTSTMDVIELDLEKFFDKVNHDKLMGLLAKQVTDKYTLKLIRSYLTSGILPARA